MAALLPRLAKGSPAEQLAALESLSTVEPTALPPGTPDPAAAVRPFLEAADPVMAAKAGDLLAHWGDRAATPGLIQLLGAAEPLIRLSAATSLAALADPAAANALAGATTDLDANVRAEACVALGTIEQPGAAAALRARLVDTDGAVRAAAADALGKLRRDRDVPRLLSLLRDPQPGVVSAAARGLGRMGDQRAVAPLIALLKDVRPPIRYAAASALGQLGDRAAVGPLTRMLADDDLAQRVAVLNALRSLGDAAAIPAVLDVAADGNPLLAKRIPFVLAGLYDPERHAAFAARFQDANGNVRGAVALALGVVGDARALPLLKQALVDPVPSVRKDTVQALSFVCRADCTRLLRPVAEHDPDPEVREAAGIGLALAQGVAAPGVLRRLVGGLSHPEIPVRSYAAEGLGLLGASRALEPLRKAAYTDSDPKVRLKAQVAVLRLTNPNI
ncbi:MAG: HEAT repeat domain-containing protein [Candidatus Binatia bacterium]